jgi:Mce-associated membrane protein
MPRPARLARSSALTVAAAALAIVVVTGGLAAAGVHKLSNNSGSAAPVGNAGATLALHEGGQLAVDFTTFDYRTLPADFRRTAALSTPAFAKTYLQQSRLVESSIRKVKAVSVSQVVATGLQAYDPVKGTATVLVAINDTTKNIKAPTGDVRYYRMQVQMVHEDGKWLASQVQPV